MTLGTFNRGPFLLASYLHEQLHWYALAERPRFEAILERELPTRFPEVPTERPEGAGSRHSTYLHLVMCWLELDGLRRLLGEERATGVVDVLVERGVYRWVYQVVRDQFDDLDVVFARRGVHPPGAR